MPIAPQLFKKDIMCERENTPVASYLAITAK